MFIALSVALGLGLVNFVIYSIGSGLFQLEGFVFCGWCSLLASTLLWLCGFVFNR